MGVYGDMADLAAGTVGTIDDLAVDDDTAAHAGAQCDHNGAAAALRCAHPDLAQCGHVGIVAYQHPDAAQQLAELNGHIAVAPAAQVCAYDGNDAGIQHRAGHAHAHTLDHIGSQAFFLHLLLHGGGQIFQDVCAGVRSVGGHFPFFQQLAVGGEQTDLGGGAAQVDAECIFLHSIYPFDADMPQSFQYLTVYHILPQKSSTAAGFHAIGRK